MLLAHLNTNEPDQMQKGVCGFLYNDADMPFAENGMKPDMIFNPFGIPSRMTTGVIFEGMLSKICAHLGSSSDATMFKKIDTDNIADMLEKYGFKRNGTERLYNGMTGLYMDVEIFIAPIYYQALQKYTMDIITSHGMSPSDCLSKQPLRGRKIDGGARMGQMEGSCLSTHGVNILHEKFGAHSDGFDLFICSKCGNRAIVNIHKELYNCNYCGTNADIQKVNSTYTSRLFMDELNSIGIGTKLHLKKPQYEMFDT